MSSILYICNKIGKINKQYLLFLKKKIISNGNFFKINEVFPILSIYQFYKFKYINLFMTNKQVILVQIKNRDTNTIEHFVNIFNRKFQNFDKVSPIIWTLFQIQIN